MNSPTSATDRLSISHLMLLTAGIGIALVIAQIIEYLRFTADAHYYNLERVSRPDLFGMLVASIYGLSVTLLLFALRSKDFWKNPGKTLALLFASMCILHWSLEFFAALVTRIRLSSSQIAGTVDERGYVLGIWYRSFAVDVGYVACLPVLFYVIYKTREQAVLWRVTWVGFLLFALLIIGQVHLGLTRQLPTFASTWYFEIAIGIPICLMLVATIHSAFRGRLNWWTTVTSVAIAGVWFIAMGIKMTG